MQSFVAIGRLTKDPDLKTVNDKFVCHFDIAVDSGFKNAEGKFEADFFRVVAWNKLAENCGNYLQKGQMVAVKGKVRNRAWKDNEGNTRRSLEVWPEQVKFLEKAKEKQEAKDDDGVNLDDLGL